MWIVVPPVILCRCLCNISSQNSHHEHILQCRWTRSLNRKRKKKITKNEERRLCLTLSSKKLLLWSAWCLSYLRKEKKRKKISSKSQKEEINWRKKKTNNSKEKSILLFDRRKFVIFSKSNRPREGLTWHPNFEELPPAQALEKLYYYRASATKYYNYFYLITIPN